MRYIHYRKINFIADKERRKTIHFIYMIKLHSYFYLSLNKVVWLRIYSNLNLEEYNSVLYNIYIHHVLLAYEYHCTYFKVKQVASGKWQFQEQNSKTNKQIIIELPHTVSTTFNHLYISHLLSAFHHFSTLKHLFS